MPEDAPDRRRARPVVRSGYRHGERRLVPPPGDRDAQRKDSRGSRRRRRAVATVLRWTRRIIMAVLLCALAGIVALYLLLRHYEQGLPSTAELRNYDPPQVTRILARDGSLLAELFIERRTVVGIEDIPNEIKIAVLAAEDADFYQHQGLDYLGMVRALLINLRSAKARQGGSTITQQVIKNVLLTPDRTFERKAREVLLARRIEQQLSKDEILELYLNHIYFGHGRYGIEEAARYFFGKGVGQVSLAEAALLAGLPRGPGLYSPRIHLDRALKRRNQVLDQIGAKGFASRELVERARRSPIVLAPAAESLAELAPEVVDEVERTLRELVGPGARRGGFTITTTIDPELQAAARRAVRKNLDDYAHRHGLLGPLRAEQRRPGGTKPPTPFQGTPVAQGHHVYWAVVTKGADDRAGTLAVRVGTVDGRVQLAEAERYNPKALPPSAFAPPGTLIRVSPVTDRGVGSDGVPQEFRLELGPQSAMLVIDVRTRNILAIVGSYEAMRGGLDRASFALRQPGSSFKPVVYSLGLQQRRLTPVTIIPKPGAAPDAPPLLLRQALAHSDNDAAVWALSQLGAESVVSWAHGLGIESQLGATDSLALGAYEVTPRQLAAAYATLAAGGMYQQPRLIAEITDRDGAVLGLPAPAARRVMDEPAAYVMTSLLESVVSYGTARAARRLKPPMAGKTGTTNSYKDAWFGGYSPDLVCVVWTGYDDAVSLGKGEHGAKAALPAFMELMQWAYQQGPLAKQREAERRPPDGVVVRRIDPATGLLAYEDQKDALTEVFVSGTEPAEVAADPEADAGADGGDGGQLREGDDDDDDDDDGADGEADAVLRATPTRDGGTPAPQPPAPDAPAPPQPHPPPF